MILLEVGNLDGLVVILVSIMVIPPIILTIIGFSVRKNYKKTALVKPDFYIKQTDMQKRN